MKRLKLEDPDIVEIDGLVESIDWIACSDKNKSDFTNAVALIHLTTNVKSRVSAVAEARRNSLIGVLATVGILMLFSAELLTIFVATLVTQMLFFGYSQILEFGTEKIFDENKRKMKSLLKSLPQLKGHDE
jgi:hypothetical protein